MTATTAVMRSQMPHRSTRKAAPGRDPGLPGALRPSARCALSMEVMGGRRHHRRRLLRRRLHRFPGRSDLARSRPVPAVPDPTPTASPTKKSRVHAARGNDEALFAEPVNYAAPNAYEQATDQSDKFYDRLNERRKLCGEPDAEPDMGKTSTSATVPKCTAACRAWLRSTAGRPIERRARPVRAHAPAEVPTLDVKAHRIS